MEAVDKEQAYDEMVEHINKQVKEPGGAYSKWYCGIASDWYERLFKEHNVPTGEDWWRTVRKCFNSYDSRVVETKLHKLGCDGGPSGGDKTTVYVYAYLKGTMTKP